MILGLPRGFFYYDQIKFIRRLLDGTEVQLLEGQENDVDIMETGIRHVVDEACLPVKMFSGQVHRLKGNCDSILIPRIMKDINGRWLCPKLLGIYELCVSEEVKDHCLVTEPIYFQRRRQTEKSFRRLCESLGIPGQQFKKNFCRAYNEMVETKEGGRMPHVESAWEFIPPPPQPGEILLPNMKTVLVLGHCYNIYDKFINCCIMEKLDQMGISTVTEKAVTMERREEAVKGLGLIKKPFWESLVRNLGTAVLMKDQVDGVIYLSSFSCGPDALIIELVKDRLDTVPLLILKLDEHRGEAGMETRLEAFADLLEERWGA